MSDFQPSWNRYTSPSASAPVGTSQRHAHEILDANPTACMLLDKNGYLLGLNRAAEALLQASDGLCLRNGTLLPSDPWKRRAFCDLLTTVHRGFSDCPCGVLWVDRSIKKQPLQLIVSPLEAWDGAESRGQMLLHAIDLDQTISIPETLLKQLYRMTLAEAQIANSLLQGLSIREIAAIRHVSVATVRSQVKILLDKTDTNRQAELLRLLMMIARALPMSDTAIDMVDRKSQLRHRCSVKR